MPAVRWVAPFLHDALQARMLAATPSSCNPRPPSPPCTINIVLMILNQVAVELSCNIWYVCWAQTAAAVLDLLDVVLPADQQENQQQQQATMGFCMVRPPGHHVKASRPMGFGLINFIAVAAQYALQQPHINKVCRPQWVPVRCQQWQPLQAAAGVDMFVGCIPGRGAGACVVTRVPRHW
jgi:hypothetical protein